jgi:hypothetical protein
MLRSTIAASACVAAFGQRALPDIERGGEVACLQPIRPRASGELADTAV